MSCAYSAVRADGLKQFITPNVVYFPVSADLRGALLIVVMMFWPTFTQEATDAGNASAFLKDIVDSCTG